MVFVPEGPFWMGCNADVDPNCSGAFEARELPYHEVWLSSFWIDRTEVSVGAYQECIDAGACGEPSRFNWPSRPTFPVNGTSFGDAVAYCAFAGKRLPTEAEWEKAARGTDGRMYPWGNEAPTCELASYTPESGGACTPGGAPVGSRPRGASPYGAWDMAGSVKEFVSDYYAGDYYAWSPEVDPTGPETGHTHPTRGGAFGRPEPAIRVSVRDTMDEHGASNFVGFRCARDG